MSKKEQCQSRFFSFNHLLTWWRDPLFVGAVILLLGLFIYFYRDLVASRHLAQKIKK